MSGPGAAPKVSVALICYNQRAYVAQALDSALAQTTPFPVELVVGDDASTDGTSEIVARLAREHPQRIRLLQRQENLGMHRNLESVLAACSGDYVALLEGDDYWSSPDKLARQAACLDTNADLVGCYTAVERISSTTDRPGPARSKLAAEGDIGMDDLLRVCEIVTCSAMFRRAALPSYPDWFHQLPVADWPLFLELARHGRFRFLPEAMAVHRYHEGGVWTSLSRERRISTMLDCYEAFHERFGRTARQPIVAGVRQHVQGSIRFLADSGAGDGEVRRSLGQYIRTLLRFRALPSGQILRWWAGLQFPILLRLVRAPRPSRAINASRDEKSSG